MPLTDLFAATARSVKEPMRDKLLPILVKNDKPGMVPRKYNNCASALICFMRYLMLIKSAEDSN